MNKKIRVALFMSMNQVMTKYSGIMPLINKLIEDDSIQFSFLYTNNVPDSVMKFIKYRVSNLAEPYSFSKVKDNNTFDYVITIDPYYGPYCKGSGYNKWGTKIIYKEYGITGIDGSDYLYKRNVYNVAWKIITDTEDTKRDIIRVSGRNNFDIIVGNPSFDHQLHNCLNKDKKVIIWSPHCSIIGDGKSSNVTGGRFSSFLTYYKDFSKRIPEMFNDCMFIYKLHPYLRTSIEEAKKRGLVEESFNYDEWIEEEASMNSNVYIASDEEDYYNLFNKSSLIINDSISFVAEYLYTHNPMIILRDSYSSKYSDYAEKIVNDCYYIANNFDELTLLISKFINNGEDDSSKNLMRDKYCGIYRPYLPISNSEYIVNYIKGDMK